MITFWRINCAVYFLVNKNSEYRIIFKEITSEVKVRFIMLRIQLLINPLESVVFFKALLHYTERANFISGLCLCLYCKFL